jgi:hypothetical protein
MVDIFIAKFIRLVHPDCQNSFALRKGVAASASPESQLRARQKAICFRTSDGAVPPKLLRLATEASTVSTS